MKQFDVCENLLAPTSQRAPFLLILQSDFLSEVPVRLVAPLVRTAEISAIKKLNPEFLITGKRFVLSTLELMSVRRSLIGRKVADLQSERDKIVVAIDMLFTGF
jgi:toxin CcdB